MSLARSVLKWCYPIREYPVPIFGSGISRAVCLLGYNDEIFLRKKTQGRTLESPDFSDEDGALSKRSKFTAEDMRRQVFL
jgi:hypothetical protein